MIITRSPFRISFFGGGTDYPVWYRENEGAVLATTINKYCYISVRYLPPFFEYTNRVVWSKIEQVKDVAEIEHPAVRATLKFLEILRGISLHHDADLPARSGLGSSSTFTVGLLHALHGLEGRLVSKQQLAAEAIHLEQEVMQENVGCQDQIMAANGGFCRINFTGDDYNIAPIILPAERLSQFQSHLMLFFTGLSRTASEIAKKQVETTKNKQGELRAMYQMVPEGINILKGQGDLAAFGALLHESWNIKRSLTDKISNPYIDDLYTAAREAGALGGKLLGAGGGGFMLIFAKPEMQARIRERLGSLLHVPFQFENMGTQTLFYESNGNGRHFVA